MRVYGQRKYPFSNMLFIVCVTSASKSYSRGLWTSCVRKSVFLQLVMQPEVDDQKIKCQSNQPPCWTWHPGAEVNFRGCGKTKSRKEGRRHHSVSCKWKDSSLLLCKDEVPTVESFSRRSFLFWWLRHSIDRYPSDSTQLCYRFGCNDVIWK